MATKWAKGTAEEKAGCQRGASGLRWPATVNSHRPRMAAFLSFSGRSANGETATRRRLGGATLLSEVGAGGRRKLGAGEGLAHQSLKLRGRRSSELVRSPPRVRRCHRCPASLPDASAGAELVMSSRPPSAWLATCGAVAVLAVDPMVVGLHLRARASRRAEPPALPATALTHETFRCAMGIIGSTPTYELLRLQRGWADLAPAASGSLCRPATSDA